MINRFEVPVALRSKWLGRLLLLPAYLPYLGEAAANTDDRLCDRERNAPFQNLPVGSNWALQELTALQGIAEQLRQSSQETPLQSLENGRWLNEPTKAEASNTDLWVTTDANTDFWRETHYGFVRDSGHFYAFQAKRDFTAQVRIQAQFKHLYDQAGLMVRLNERRWVKTGIEFSDGYGLLSSVLTNETSDWATGRYDSDPSDFWIRVTVQSGVLRIQASYDGRTWPLVRLCPFPEADHYLVGPMCCTPERAGLEVRFSEWRLGRALGKELHDLSQPTGQQSALYRSINVFLRCETNETSTGMMAAFRNVKRGEYWCGGEQPPFGAT